MRQRNQQWLPHFMPLSIGLWLAILLSLLEGASSQISNTELCACSPRVYELTFDFDLECEPINVDFESGGILDATCHVNGFDNINVTDLVPVAVSSVQLIEIGQGGAPIAVEQYTGDYRDGDSIEYTSISFEGAVAPRAFQVRALGRNEAGEPLVLQWAITYSNNCGVWPVLEINDSIGWTIFTGLARPIAIACPAAAVDTENPTGPPTLNRTPPPTSAPTPSPTGTTPSPTIPPTLSPTEPPSEPPTQEPTVTPSVPSIAPTTQAPTSEVPVPELSFSYSFSYDHSLDDIEDEDLEFGREEASKKDKTPSHCRKKRIRLVRRVRKNRALLGKKGVTRAIAKSTPTGKAEKSEHIKKLDMRAENVTDAENATDAENVTDAKLDSTNVADMPVVDSDEEVGVDDTDDEAALIMDSIDETTVAAVDADEDVDDDEYELIEEYEEVDVCEGDELYELDESFDEPKGTTPATSPSMGKGKGKGKGDGDELYELDESLDEPKGTTTATSSSKGKGGKGYISGSKGKGGSEMSLKDKSSKGSTGKGGDNGKGIQKKTHSSSKGKSKIMESSNDDSDDSSSKGSKGTGRSGYMGSKSGKGDTGYMGSKGSSNDGVADKKSRPTGKGMSLTSDGSYMAESMDTDDDDLSGDMPESMDTDDDDLSGDMPISNDMSGSKGSKGKGGSTSGKGSKGTDGSKSSTSKGKGSDKKTSSSKGMSMDLGMSSKGGSSDSTSKGKGDSTSKGKGDSTSKGKGDSTSKGKGDSTSKGKGDSTSKGKGDVKKSQASSKGMSTMDLGVGSKGAMGSYVGDISYDEMDSGKGSGLSSKGSAKGGKGGKGGKGSGLSSKGSTKSGKGRSTLLSKKSKTSDAMSGLRNRH